MNEEERMDPSQLPEELNATSERDSEEPKGSRYRFIISCGLEKESTGEGKDNRRGGPRESIKSERESIKESGRKRSEKRLE